jgi:predicted nucleic acid-binding protein
VKVLVDTSVWSLALRRRAPRHEVADALRRLVTHGRAALLGPIRQELLSGIREPPMFARLREHLQAFPDEPIVTDDYERGAELFNACRAVGLQGSNTDFLICAVSERLRYPILTTDGDFARYARVIPVVLYREEERA